MKWLQKRLQKLRPQVGAFRPQVGGRLKHSDLRSEHFDLRSEAGRSWILVAAKAPTSDAVLVTVAGGVPPHMRRAPFLFVRGQLAALPNIVTVHALQHTRDSHADFGDCAVISWCSTALSLVSTKCPHQEGGHP
eukprot:gene9271-biopygen8884